MTRGKTVVHQRLSMALRDDDDRLRRFPASPPRHPAADLPLSLMLDTALLPMTVPVALYEVLFEPR